MGIFHYVLPYRASFFTGLILLVLVSGTVMFFPYATGKLIDLATGTDTWIVFESSPYALTIDTIDEAALFLGAIFLLQAVLSFFRVLLFARVSENVLADIRTQLYQQLMSLPMFFYDKNRAGDIISRSNNDVTTLHTTVSITLAELLRQIVVLVIGITMIFILTPSLSIFMLAIFPVVIIATMIFGRFIRRLSKKTQDELAMANVIVEETIQAIASVKAFTSELWETRRYRGSMQNVVRVAMRTATFRAGFIAFLTLALFGTIVAIMWYGAKLVAEGNMSVGDLITFLFYTAFIGGSIGGLGNIFGQVQQAIGASERVLEILKEPIEQDLNEDEQTVPLTGAIQYDKVRFNYPTRKEIEVLKDLSLDIPAGSKTALVGHSGAGKSTIAQLLMRFYEPTNGQISIGGKPIQSLPIRALRKQMAIVPQEVILFGGTLEENIRYGKPNASREEIIAAAKEANAWQFIEGFPEQLETLVGERGVKLSGGQRQRIAIARAILKNPSILILDEATSSLDAESEYLVQQALNELMKNRTTIIIAHRLATIRSVDQIYVLRDGCVIESGTHNTLINREGEYKKLVELQFLDAEPVIT